MITTMGRGLNAVRLSTPSDELEAIANEARRELASAEARITALLERAGEISTTAVKDQVELRRYIEEFGFEIATLERQEAIADHGTGPLFDVDAMRQSARELNSDVSRSNALESNLSIVLHMLQDAGSQLTPERVFARILDTADLRLQQAMNSAREDERRRLAREIHDGPAQVLSNAIFAVHTTEQIAKRAPHQIVDELTQLRELLKDGVAEIRRFMFDLRPTMLQDLGLGPTLARYVDDYSRFFAKKVMLRTDEALPHLTPDQELTIFRIVQEALQNIHKHAGQGVEASVTLNAAGSVVQLTVSDNGKGFDPHGVVPRATSGAGLPGMRERANLAGGELNVQSQAGNGTTITLRMPLRGQTGPLRPST
jgi:two-component system, NarL family, sensor histidine kinase DegS